MSVSLPPEAHAGLARYNQQVQEELAKQLRQQLAEHCFKKCIASKGGSLSGDRLVLSEAEQSKWLETVNGVVGRGSEYRAAVAARVCVS